MKAHPVAELFPMLGEDDLRSLAEDIKANGLRHPIVLDTEGRILDGRNRAAACRLAKVRPTYEKYEGDPAAYVLSANVERRHLNAGQRAMLAAKARSLLSNTQAAAAKAANVSQPRIAQADAVLVFVPYLAEKVIAGDLPLNDAYAEAQDAKKARTEALVARNESFDRAIDFLTEFGEWPERSEDLRDQYAPLYPTNPVTADKLRRAAEGIQALRKVWPA